MEPEVAPPAEYQIDYKALYMELVDSLNVIDKEVVAGDRSQEEDGTIVLRMKVPDEHKENILKAMDNILHHIRP